MNRELFNELFEKRPSQHRREWLAFLEICEMYLKKCSIEKPVVVELGVYNNMQKKFYEQLLGAEHIGIDISDRRSDPDIKGDTHDFETLNTLRKKLNGRFIDILFIDACHKYDDVRKDFEIYSPLCSNVIAFHDTEIGRRRGRAGHQVWKFWDSLKDTAYIDEEKYRGFLFFSIQHGGGPGIGVMMRDD